MQFKKTDLTLLNLKIARGSIIKGTVTWMKQMYTNIIAKENKIINFQLCNTTAFNLN